MPPWKGSSALALQGGSKYTTQGFIPVLHNSIKYGDADFMPSKFLLICSYL